MSASRQHIRFCTAPDGIRLAYATVGTGPPLVKAAHWLTHLEYDWDSPVWRHMLTAWSRHHTLIRYDERGCGLSDWEVDDFSVEAWVHDLETVVDTLGLERFPLLGMSQGGPVAMAYAVRHPERVSHLILYGSYARGLLKQNLSAQMRDEAEALLKMTEIGWGRSTHAYRQIFTSLFVPDADAEQMRWFDTLQQSSTSPENAVRFLEAFYKIDVSELAPKVTAPSLVLHCRDDKAVPFKVGRELAALIPEAQFILLEGRNHVLLESDTAWPRFIEELYRFLGVSPADKQKERLIGTERWDQLSALFKQAVALPPDERQALLDEAAASDAVLRHEVEELLSMDAESSSNDILGRALDAPLEALLATPTAPVQVGQQVSHYQIIERLGGGGMGVVYKARDTRLDRPVALKFLPSHLSAHEQIKQRFAQEAKAASALDHPNICTIYGIDEMPGGQLFIAMAYYDGETLRAKIANGLLSVERALEYAQQIARGLARAHEAGIVHRDVKPANIMVTERGHVKVLDFGIAKVAGLDLTRTGTTMGTVAYMSPEQVRSEGVDHRTDLWSLGVVLYEMLTGERPFRGDYEQAIMYSILHEEPRPVTVLRPALPGALNGFLRRLLEKDPAQRLPSADAVLQHLRELASVDYASASGTRELDALLPYMEESGDLVELVVLPKIKQLAEQGAYPAAYALTKRAEPHLLEHPGLARMMLEITDRLSIITQPAGARVYVQRFSPDEDSPPLERVFLGETPIQDLRLARGDYRVEIEKEGFVSFARMASSNLQRMEQSFGIPLDITIETRLLASSEVPDDMVFVPGGAYHLVGAGAPTQADITLDDFFLDKYQVSNEQFKAFIQAGGYAKKAYWEHPFVREEKTISWKEAMRYFLDRTGLPGPRSWLNQEYPEGKGRHPVTCISWYEAAAYAAWADKRLPTIFEWEKAARDGAYTHFEGAVMPWGWVGTGQSSRHRANFSGSGTEPVDAYPFGISPYGAYNMAGNAKEWCLNAIDGAYTVTGGSWEDPMYLFGDYGAFSGFYASPSLGFRCARNTLASTSDQGAMQIVGEQQTPVYEPADEATFASFLNYYQYDRRPLHAEVIDTQTTTDWVREKVRFAGIGGDPILVYLYLPVRAPKPYQSMVFVPGANVFFEQSVPEQVEWLLSPHIKAGRAVLAVVMKGMIERDWEPGRLTPEPDSVQFRDEMVLHTIELRLGLDYLETRDDIDMDRLAYVAFSRGGASRLIFAAVENRYRSAIFIGGGIDERLLPTRPEANCVNFASYIKPPILMVTGKYDEEHPYRMRALPLYNLLSEPKKLVLVDGGHLPSLEARVPVINAWLDETLGPVDGTSTDAERLPRRGIRPERPSTPSIAVLPFADMSSGRDQDYFCEGIAEELINALTRIDSLRVASRTSSFQFKGTAMDIREIGERLGVSTVLEGSVRRAGNQLRITVQLINAIDGYHLWSERYDRGVEDIFAVQDEIAERTVEALRGILTEEDREALHKAPVADIAAYDYYLQGRHLLPQGNRASLEKARRLFKQAIELDAAYASAYAGIVSSSYFLYQWSGQDEADLEEARQASRRAVDLAPDLAESHVARGLALALERRFAEAEEAMEQALRLNPNQYDAHYYYARISFEQGKLEQAALLFQRAGEIDPQEYQSVNLLAQVYQALGRTEAMQAQYLEGFARIERHLELSPEDVRAVNLGAGALLQLGERERGLEWTLRALAMAPDDPIVVWNTACNFAQADQLDTALDHLERAVALGIANRHWLEHDPDMDPLRDNPRFQALLKAMP